MTDIRERPLAVFKSKAETLQLLSVLLQQSSVEELHAFSQADWERDHGTVISSIQDVFGGKTIIVRSSALAEDTVDSSNAGYFESILGVDSANPEAIHTAVRAVVMSYIQKDCGHPDNLVLVQAQTMDAVCSGTILTRDYNGAPYYVINYSEEDTASVTSGRQSKSIKILHSGVAQAPATFAGLIEAVQEIEQLSHPGMPLDIEFGIKSNGDVVTFQVRPLVAAQTAAFKDDVIIERVQSAKSEFARLIEPKPHLAGDTTVLGDMPDWNPAEIIGHAPHILAVSLYDEIITGSVWHQARTSQGYTDVNPAKLVVQLGNKPYVDVRHTFNSLVPASIPGPLREKLLSFYLQKLKANPQLQDKVEFDILYTCYDLSFSTRTQELLGTGFTAAEVATLRAAVLQLTNNLLSMGAIEMDIAENEELETYRQSLPVLGENASLQEYIERVIVLLAACKEKGTLQFSRLARLGFIGKTLLRSLVHEGIIDHQAYDTFLNSITTVASEFAHDMDELVNRKRSKADFLRRYGHLRPGTYDITVPRYDASDAYFGVASATNAKAAFALTAKQHADASAVLREHGFTVTSQELFDFVRNATEAREYSKFLFSRSLSDAIEATATAGSMFGFSREDVSHLDIDAFRDARGKDATDIKREWTDRIVQNRANYELNSYLLLPPVVFQESDLEVVSYYTSRPNFITSKKMSGEAVFLKGDAREDITGKVVIIESADPGYDWVFTKNPGALITKYGGPASHMAIRCAELSLPAVIGAGEMTYESLANARSVTIDCENERIEPHGKAG
jgi:phosphohistidine swiveling domain-containing protein